MATYCQSSAEVITCNPSSATDIPKVFGSVLSDAITPVKPMIPMVGRIATSQISQAPTSARVHRSDTSSTRRIAIVPITVARSCASDPGEGCASSPRVRASLAWSCASRAALTSAARLDSAARSHQGKSAFSPTQLKPERGKTPTYAHCANPAEAVFVQFPKKRYDKRSSPYVEPPR